ncbi:MAG TPA: hypothetical protein VFQ09_03060, partial [Rubrobacter sp.]|nr:hypothetical protein [Rubrobacter sp.]
PLRQREPLVASRRSAGRRVADLGRSLVDTFLRDNRLLPPVLALLALFVFAWVLAGVFVGGTDEQRPVANRSEIAQADDPGATDPAAPEVDNPNVDSYAAYRSKDPFRQLFVFARTTPEVTTTGEVTTNGRPAGGGNRRGADSDRDGLTDRKEEIFGQEPGIPDTDGDGIPDGLDDSDGDGIPDGVEGNAAGGGNNRAGGGGRGAGDRPGRGGGLLDSGGTLSPP